MATLICRAVPCPGACILLTAAILCGVFGGAASAQQNYPVQDVKFGNRDLRLDALDLRLEALDLQFAAIPVVLPTKRITFPVQDMMKPVLKSKKEVKFALNGDVMFEFDKSVIRPKAEDILRKLSARIRKEFRRGPIRVEGYTDSMGSDAYNKKLSERRALAVKDWFVKMGGLPARRIAARGYGESHPIAPNTKDGKDYPEGRQKNRRVEIVVRPR